ncbi:MAG: hypothetical protein IIY05_01645 [Alistipes sp.]|nr:hypothetical protein [Alistipes sp.]
MTSIQDIVDAVANPYTPWRTLKGLEIKCEDDMPQYITGNASVIFTVMHNNRRKILKCYKGHNPHLPAIYGKEFHPTELCVSNIMGQHFWIDCLLTDYIEGCTLHEKLCQHLTAEELGRLATAFDKMAGELLQMERAHGDIKPENIIVGYDGSMTLIDWDAAYVPALKGKIAVETGTAAYQHPLRDQEFFDKHIDNYSIALISTLLHAYATSPDMAEYYREHHHPQAHPREIYHPRSSYSHRRNLSSNKSDNGDWLYSVLDLFARKCMPRQYHIARLLRDNTPQLFTLKRLFFPPETLPTYDEQEIEANVWNGLWGYSAPKGWAIVPLFDECQDPKDGVLQVRLAEYKHLLKGNGDIITSLDAAIKVKIRHGVIYFSHSSKEQPFKEIIL